ncbi:MAG: radical SAM protein [Syntrophorhabdaceae bacterium]|nr:radical SAM protein [Syntrophorhabdaceae bacterium]
MKITFIMPSVGKVKGRSYIRSWQMEPLTIATLAGLTPGDVETRFIDDRIEEVTYDDLPDLAAINCETYTAGRAYSISSQYKKRGVPVVLGGFHPTLMPEEAAMFADSVVIGEAEGVWGQVIEDAKRHRIQKTYRSNRRPGLERISPDRSIFKGKKYLPVTLVESSRGCKFNCRFCSITNYFKASCNYRPIGDIVKELAGIKKKGIFFVDDNVASSPDRAKDLFREIASLGIKWIGQGSINMAKDRGLIGLMKKSGCLGLLVGLESLDPANLELMGKRWNGDDGGFKEALKVFRDNGIAIYGTFVFGYDNDDADSFKRALDFALEQKFFLAAFNHLVPFPGTPLYDEMKKDGRLLYDKWWLEPDNKFGDVVFTPKRMSAKQLSERCFEARKKFFSAQSIIKRSLDFDSNCRNSEMMAYFFSINLFSGREVEKRQGWPLGGGI